MFLDLSPAMFTLEHFFVIMDKFFTKPYRTLKKQIKRVALLK